jgi:PKHD-type hydroxylase
MPDVRSPLVLEQHLERETASAARRAFDGSVARARTFQGLVDKRFRDCDYAIIENPLFDAVFAPVADAAGAHFGAALEPRPRHAPVVYRYPTGVGFGVHHDQVNRAEIERSRTNGQPVIGGDISAIAWLSDLTEYDGGELFFPTLALSYRLPRASIIAFPTSEQYLHGVTPITRGVRYVALWRYCHPENGT